ncbi:hypothetical protein pb186bvf_017292 [Paramecium bursaria]
MQYLELSLVWIWRTRMQIEGSRKLQRKQSFKLQIPIAFGTMFRFIMNICLTYCAITLQFAPILLANIETDILFCFQLLLQIYFYICGIYSRCLKPQEYYDRCQNHKYNLLHLFHQQIQQVASLCDMKGVE